MVEEQRQFQGEILMGVLVGGCALVDRALLVHPMLVVAVVGGDWMGFGGPLN